MTSVISGIKKSRLLPVMALLSSLLLLTGEFFNCCRINEAFAEGISQALHGLGFGSHEQVASVSEEVEHHPHCHGHHEKQHSKKISLNEKNQTVLAQEGMCISENSITKKAMVANEAWFVPVIAITLIFDKEITQALPFHTEKFIPQNRSSPPLYLTTLHLLV